MRNSRGPQWGPCLIVAVIFVALFAFECPAEDTPLLQAIKALTKKNQEDVSGTGTPGQDISCSLFMSPSHGKPGTTVLLRGTTVPPLDNIKATIEVLRSLPYASGDDDHFEELLVFEGTLRGGILETTWQCPTDTGSDSSYMMTFITDQFFCHAFRHFRIDKPPVVLSLSCEPSYVVNKEFFISAHLGSGGTFTETWYLDGKVVEGPVEKNHSSGSPFSELTATIDTVGSHTVRFVLANAFGTAEKTCTFNVVPGPPPQIAFTSQTNRLLIDEQGKWCVQWKTSTDSNTLKIKMHDPPVDQQQPAGNSGTYCFTFSFATEWFHHVYFTVTDGWGLKAEIYAAVNVTRCPEGKKECRGGCIDLTDVCCQTGPPGSCVQGQQCCGNVCCGGGEVCDATNNACCPAGSTFIAGKGICCPGNAPDVCGDKCMPSGATCCTSYHCAGAANHVCCNDGRCCPSGNICCADGGCCPAGRVCSANGGCSCPADKPTPCGPNCCASGQICRDNQCVAACLPPTCCAESPVVCSSHCCPAGSTCTPTGCSTPTVCPPDNPQLCGSMCVPAGSDCCGGGMACLPGNKCCGDHCCPTGSPCCGAGCCQGGTLCCPGATACCPQLSQCCGSGCCPTGTTCCGAGCCPAGTVCQNGGCVQASSSIQSIQSLQAPGIAPASSPLIYTGGQAAPANTLPLLLK